MAEHEALRVGLGDRSYDIEIGAGILAASAARLAEVLPSRRLCVVTDETVARHHLIPFMKALEAAGFTACPPVIMPAGEAAKSFSTFQDVVEKILSYHPDRKTALVALGGGVVGDMTGFAAASILRGVPFAQVPTTLLSQVDSSVGGKTGINTAQGKNLVGAFYQPVRVVIDTDTLKTLPARELRAGYAEVVKYAFIDNPPFFDWLEKNAAAVLAGDAAALAHAIRVSCASKAAIVAADETESRDVRALLNLGHTFGHALEALAGYDGRLLHGEAVAIGMKMAFDYSVRRGLCPVADAEKAAAHLVGAGLTTVPPFAVTARDMLDKMRGDKKNTDRKITLVLVRGIGQAFVARDTDEADLAGFLEETVQSWTR